MDTEIIENHKRYLDRIRLYKSFDYDVEKNRKFIFEIAQPIYGEILEVGTGKGYMTLLLAKEGYRLISIDISEEEQKLAKLNLKYFGVDGKVNFKIENAENLSFPDKSFDFIISVNTIHHMEKPLKVMNELIRVLTFPGTIVLGDFTEK